MIGRGERETNIVTIQKIGVIVLTLLLIGLIDKVQATPIKALNNANVVIESRGDFGSEYLGKTQSIAIKVMSSDSKFISLLKENKITGIYLRPVRGYDGGVIFKVQLGRGTERFKFSSIGITGYGQGVWLHSR